MHLFKKIALFTATSAMVGLTPMVAQAADKDLASQVTEARQEGSIWTAFALNRHLSPFKIKVSVDSGTAVLEGKVENKVDRELAEQIALDVAGIEKVNNRLEVDPMVAVEPGAKATIAQHFEDATLTATVKSKLLWNSVTEALNIQVDSKAGVVTLKGQAQSAEAKLLAGSLASNTDGVTEVNNLISLTATDPSAPKVPLGMNNAGEAISDLWITSKVKSSLIYSRNLDGINIKVDTRSGMVSLDGVVANYAAKQLAIEIARNIRGVRGVDADALKVVTATAG